MKRAEGKEFFCRIMEFCGENPKKSLSLTILSPAEYKHFRCFVSETGKSGYAVNPSTGELLSVFSSEHKGREIMWHAADHGARKVFCFDGFLTAFYVSHGYRVVDRAPWDPKQAPLGWDTESMGTPDVVWLERRLG